MRTIDVRDEEEQQDGDYKIIYGAGDAHVIVSTKKHRDVICFYDADDQMQVWTADIDGLIKALDKAQQLLEEDDDEKF